MGAQCRVTGPACRDPDTPMCLVPTVGAPSQVAGTHQGTQNQTQHRGLCEKVQNLFKSTTPWGDMMWVHISEQCKRQHYRRFSRFCSDGRFMHLPVGRPEAPVLSRPETPGEHILVVLTLFCRGKMRFQGFVALRNKFRGSVRDGIGGRTIQEALEGREERPSALLSSCSLG